VQPRHPNGALPRRLEDRSGKGIVKARRGRVALARSLENPEREKTLTTSLRSILKKATDRIAFLNKRAENIR